MLNKSAMVELAFWGAWLLLAVGLVALTYGVTQSYTLPGDRAITFRVQELYTQSWAEDVFSLGHRLGSEWIVGLVLGFTIAMLAVRRRFLEAGIVAAAALSIFLVAMLDAVIDRPSAEYNALRAVFEGLEHPRIYPHPGGFPSGHVFGGFLAYGLLFWLAPRAFGWGWLAMIVRVLCCMAIVLGFVAPMYLGAHWFTDALGGALLALLVIMLAWRADSFIRRERQHSVRDPIANSARHPSEGFPSENPTLVVHR